jgi:uncharacterized protein
VAVEGRGRDQLSARSRARIRPGKSTKPARKKTTACPICGKPHSGKPLGGRPLSGEPQDHDYSPFCSKRCADIDLSRWLGGRYAIPGAPVSKAETDSDDDRDGGS